MAYNEFDTSETSLLLGAVNVLLAVINEPPIDSIDDYNDVEEAKWALSTIKEVRESVLAEGWDINMDENYTFPLNQDNQVPIPYNVLSITDTNGDLILKEHFIYSKSRQSRNFTEPVSVTVKWNLSFNDLPAQIRRYITVYSAKVFQDRQVLDKSMHSYTLEDIYIARASASQEDVDTSGKTMLSNMTTAGLGI